MNYSVIIIDDEDDARTNIQIFVENLCPDLQIIGSANSVSTAIQSIDELKPDLIFLDIQLGDGTGFDILEKVNFNSFKTIFTTAYDSYAIKAVKVKAQDYLLKPINPIELQKAVENAILKIKEDKEYHLAVSKNNLDVSKIGLPTSLGVEITDLDQIIRLQADGNYTNVFLKNEKKIVLAKTLKIFDEILPNHLFLRVHQSHILNIQHVKLFNSSKNEIVINGVELSIPVSRRFKQSVLSILNLKII